jgi:hypothetical protein
MSRLFMVCPARPPLVQRRAFEVIQYDRADNTIHLRQPDGRVMVDTNFHIDIAKRVGYSLTAEVPPEFAHAKQP